MKIKEIIKRIKSILKKDYELISSRKYWDGAVNNKDLAIFVGNSAIYLRPKKKRAGIKSHKRGKAK